MIIKNCRMDELVNELNGRKIICAGNSKYLWEICQKNQNAFLAENIAYIVDNDKSKWNTQITLSNRTIHIYSYDSLLHIDQNKFCILITSLRYTYEILMQLNQLDYLQTVPCYSLLFIKMKESEDSKNSTANSKSNKVRIPKKIHYCWFGNGKLPEKERMCIESWKEYCPDYEIIEWNEHNYDVTKHNYMKQAYEAKKWGFVPDFARLDIIYQHGGIYLDADVELIKNLDDLLYHEAFFAFEQRNLINLGNGFGAKKESTILKELKESYDDYSFYNHDGTLNLTASPFYQTEFFRKKGVNMNNQFQKIDDMVFYPNDYFSPMEQDSGVIMATEHTYAIHHFSCSWFDDAQKQVWENTKNNAKKLMKLFKTIS